MENKKLMATLLFVGVIVMILGNIIDNTTFWIFGDLYVGIIMAISSYMFWKS